MSKPSVADRALASLAKNLISDLYSFTVAHHARCRNCRRNKGGACRTMLATYMLDHHLHEDVKRARRT